MSRKPMLAVTAVVLGIMGYVVFGSMARVNTECEVCVEFNGVRRCSKGAGANEKEARDGAMLANCGVVASGMDETIRCQATPPVSATCRRN